jgi:N-acetylmuramoyl-L-alanine amidase
MVNKKSDTINQEIIFKVQILSSSVRLATNTPLLKDIGDVWEYKENGLYKYTVGSQIDLKSASELQSEVRNKGFSGAFVVAFKNGKRITVRDARKLLASN